MAQTRYVIEGNEIRTESIQTSNVGLVSELLPSLMTYHPLEMTQLPRDISYIKTTPDGTDAQNIRVLISSQPQTRNVLFNESGAEASRATSFDIALPFVHFWFSMHGSKVTTGEHVSWVWAPQRWGVMWSREPFTGIETTNARSLGMPNMWGDTRCCFGSNPINADQSMGSYIDALINTFWTSEFNTDLDSYLPYQGGIRAGLRQWAEESAIDSGMWRNWAIWSSQRQSIQTLIESIDGGGWSEPTPDSMEAAAIPSIPIIPTFRNIDDWLNELEERDRARLIENCVNRSRA